MKQVLIILGYGELGGAEKQAIYLAERLSRKGYKTTMLNFGPKGFSNHLCDQNNIPNKSIRLRPARGVVNLLINLAKLYVNILRLRPTIIIPFTRNPNIYANLLKPFIPCTKVIWNQRDTGIGMTNDRLERTALKQADYIISNSAAGRDYLNKKYGIGTDTIAVIANGIELPRTYRHVTRFTVGMIGNLHANKDFETLLKGWKSFINKNIARDAQLLIAGRNDGLLPALVELTAKLHITDSVTFCGQVNDIHSFLGKLKVGVHSSWQEGCSNAILEMMSYGLPVIATAIPGNMEILGPGYALYFQPGDAERLAEVLSYIYQLPDMAENTGKSNLLQVREKYSVESMVHSYEKLFNE